MENDAKRALPRAILPIATLLLIGGALAILVVTGNSFESFVEEHGHAAHVAPHGGTLIMLGLHTAHFEVVLDQDSGRLDFYALDDEAVNIYALPAEPIELGVRFNPGDEWRTLTLQPDDDPAFRPGPTRAQRFYVVEPDLVGRIKFDMRFPEMSFAGRTFPVLVTGFPEGNH